MGIGVDWKMCFLGLCLSVPTEWLFGLCDKISAVLHSILLGVLERFDGKFHQNCRLELAEFSGQRSEFYQMMLGSFLKEF